MTSISRREAILATAAGMSVAAASSVAVAAGAPRGAEFLWGVATAAHQIEGNNVNSDLWVLETIPHTGYREPSGDACDSWTRWREDIALIKGLGLNAYRFSVEWARIEPEPGRFSVAVLDQYRRICAECREAGITPVVTYHHFTNPRWIAGLGAWENLDIVDHFTRYCERTTEAIGDLLDWACTLNEPNAQVTSYVMRGEKPFKNEAVIEAEAARAVGSDRFGAFFMGDAFKVRDICLAAHAKAVTAIKSRAPHVKVGMTLALQDLKAGPDGEMLYHRVFDTARAPFYAAAAKDDFIGVQPYLHLVTGPTDYLPTPAGVERNRTGGDSAPDVISAVIHEVHANCRAPIMITENGIDAADEAQRTRHLIGTIAQLDACRKEGIPLLGYFYWSLLDNFEWSSGYGPRMGLYAVDRRTFERTAKPAAAVYKALVAQERRRAART